MRAAFAAWTAGAEGVAPAVEKEGTDELKVPLGVISASTSRSFFGGGEAGETASSKRTFVGAGARRSLIFGTNFGSEILMRRGTGPPAAWSGPAGLAGTHGGGPQTTADTGGAASPAGASDGPGPGWAATAGDGNGSGPASAGCGPGRMTGAHGSAAPASGKGPVPRGRTSRARKSGFR